MSFTSRTFGGLRWLLATLTLTTGLTWAQTSTFGITAPASPSISGVSTSSVQINWQPSLVTGSDSTSVSYYVYRSGVPVNAAPLLNTSYVDRGLMPSSTYSWTVRAYAQGALSSHSAAVATATLALQAPTPSGPPAPTRVTTSNATTRTMQINWIVVPSTGSGTFSISYNVFRNGNKVNALPVYATQFKDTQLTPATSYTWTVAAVNAQGTQGSMSQPATGATSTPGPICFRGINAEHVQAGRAYRSGAQVYARGSHQLMGQWPGTTLRTLRQTGPNTYEMGPCH